MSLVRFRPEAPLSCAPLADLAHLVERDLAKVEVAGSSPVIRSTDGHEKLRARNFIRRHSQAVRQRSAKPLFPGPIPGGASKKSIAIAMDFFICVRSSQSELVDTNIICVLARNII